MATVDRNTIKSWFRKGLKPLESQFAAWIDSFWHKNDSIPIGSVDQLPGILSDKADVDYVQNAIQDAVANVTVRDASLTSKGIVQLANQPGYSDELAATQSLVGQVVDNLAGSYYTITQINDLIDEQIMGLTWKDWVSEYSDLQATYPNPEVGWLVPVAADSKIYKWNGSAWVDSHLGSIPAGLLKFDTNPSNAPTHDNHELATKDYVDGHIPQIPDASTTQKGIVQLSDVVNDDNYYAVTGHAVREAVENLVGEPGPQGPPGPDGLSAFEVWLQQPDNDNKTVSDFFESLRGEKGADGQPGAAGVNGLSAYEQWQSLPGNSYKSFDDFLNYLSTLQGFAFNVLFYNTSESVVSFASPAAITHIAKDAGISSATYSTNGIDFITMPMGTVSVEVDAGQPLFIRVVFSAGATIGTLTIKGDYI